MSKWEEHSILIERYLDGDLSSDEKQNFEKLISEDAKLLTEFELHKQIRKDIRLTEERKVLRGKLNEMHKTYFSHPGSAEAKVIAHPNRSLSIIISIAAGLSLLITAGSIAVYHYGMKELQKKNDYVQVDRPVEEAETSSPSEKANEKNDKNVASILIEPSKAATAFAITSDGWVITSYHTVKDKKKVTLEKVGDSSKTFSADVRFFDRKMDLAILKINDKQFTTLGKIPYSFAQSDASIAQKVFTLGYPKDDIVYSEGFISSLSGFKMDTLAYQAGITVNPGNSGAPLFNENGEIVGVIAGKHASEDGASYAIKTRFFLKMLKHVSLPETETKITLPAKSTLKGKKTTDQVKTLESFIFIIKA